MGRKRGSFLLGRRLGFKKCMSEWPSAVRWVSSRDGVVGFWVGTKKESMVKINEILILRVIGVHL